MNDCCDIPKLIQSESIALCAECGVRGRSVERRTVLHHVKSEHFSQVRIDDDYRFCPSQDCKVAYYSVHTVFTINDVRELITAKVSGDSRPLCYCFGYTEGDIRKELTEARETGIPAQISKFIKEKICACEIRNPSGSCCFAQVTQTVKNLKAEQQTTAALKAIKLPNEMSYRLQKVFHLAQLPNTFADIGLSSTVKLGPFTATNVTALVSDTPTNHSVQIGGELHYTYCIMDALMLPVLRNQPAQIESIDPHSGSLLRLRLTPGGDIISDQEIFNTVISFGVTCEGEGSVYAIVCPYINLFASRANYEQWALNCIDAFTIAMPLIGAAAVARIWSSTTNGCCPQV